MFPHRIAHGGTDVRDRQHLGEAQEEPAQHGAADVAHAAQDDDRDALVQHRLAHQREQRVRVQPDQHAGHAAQGSCGERGGDEQALDVDAQQPGGLGRFGNGAQRAAELRAAHDVHQHGHQRERQEDDAQLDDGQVQTGNFDHFLGHG
ncbi:hypothetical protein G6F65_021224 [Rhizopus arrhizus]|nr:hypothetical protein G6F65_021224 [Rhizopus arrhizus]